MNETELSRLTAVLAEVVDLSGIEVTEASVLGTDIPIDSRDMLRVLARVRRRFGVTFNQREVLALRTLGDLLALVHRSRK